MLSSGEAGGAEEHSRNDPVEHQVLRQGQVMRMLLVSGVEMTCRNKQHCESPDRTETTMRRPNRWLGPLVARYHVARVLLGKRKRCGRPEHDDGERDSHDASTVI